MNTILQNRAITVLVCVSVVLAATTFSYLTGSYWSAAAGTGILGCLLWLMRTLPAELAAESALESMTGDTVSSIPELAAFWSPGRPQPTNQALALAMAGAVDRQRIARGDTRRREIAAAKLALAVLLAVVVLTIVVGSSMQ